MHTVYFATDRFIRHQDNLVDLTAYRQKLDALSSPCPELTAAEPLPCAVSSPAPHRRTVGERLAWLGDVWASMAVVVMTLTFTLRVLG